MAIRYELHAPAVRQFIKERAASAAGVEPHTLRGDGLAWFAERIDTSASHLSRLLNGKQPLTHDMAIRIANGLEVPHDVVYRSDLNPTRAQGVAS